MASSSSDEPCSLELDLKISYTDPPSSNPSASHVVEPHSISEVGILTEHGNKPEGICVVLPGQADQYEIPTGSYGDGDNGIASSNDDQSKTLHGLSIPIPGVTTPAPSAPSAPYAPPTPSEPSEPCAAPTPSEPSEPLIPELSALVNSTQTQLTVDDSSVSEKSVELAVNKASISPYRDYHKELVLRSYQEEIVQRSLRGENDIILLPTGTGKTYVAIKVIIEHLDKLRDGHPKVVFLVPTAELAIQQLEKVKDHLPLAWSEKAMKVIGDSNIPVERLKELIKDDEFVVFVVTPQIINNYFCMSSDASLSDFTLLIFDEYHHAKKDHPYNELIKKCFVSENDGSSPVQLPQLLGMTATIGIGDSRSKEKAIEYIIGMCAKFGMQQPPSDSPTVYAASQSAVEEKYVHVSSTRRDGMSDYLQAKLMAVLEQRISAKLKLGAFKENGVSVAFPMDRHNQMYEQYVVNLLNVMPAFHQVEELKESTNYCMVALEHLRVYYKALQLISLLHCKHGMDYIMSGPDHNPSYISIDEIWTLFKENKAELERLQKLEDSEGENQKILELKSQLQNLFLEQPESKVIIFVQMRVVAHYMADLLSELDPMFKAKEFTSTGPSAEEAGMNQQQRYNALQGFEGNKYNIIVATSVLEEGIDIQACNMVVRYMYVKDMIAKIQSRGRARHEKGVMIALVDQKLYNQEQRNNFKERLMFSALREIQGMPNDEFKAKLAEQRKLMTPKKVSAERPRAMRSQAKISCKVCGLHLGSMTDVRRYGVSHFLIIDGALCEKVTPFPDPQIMKAMDGMVPFGKLICKGDAKRTKPCGNRVGTLMKMDSGMHFGMWYIKGICVNNNPLKKYKDVQEKHNVQIQPITADELRDVGPDNEFPTHLLRAT